MPADWTDLDVEEYLNDWPLPADFTWTRVDIARDTKEKILTPDTAVRPKHHGLAYGKWLHETPYFPGLFERIRDELRAVPIGDKIPTPEELAARLQRPPEQKSTQPTLF